MDLYQDLAHYDTTASAFHGQGQQLMKDLGTTYLVVRLEVQQPAQSNFVNFLVPYWNHGAELFTQKLILLKSKSAA